MSEYRLTTLKNGLRVATERLPGAHTIALAISVDVGARYEDLSENGLSHFLEHMAFKGTKTRSAKDIAEIFDDVGASLNAFTSNEQTVYYARFLPKDLPLTVEVLADILQNSTFTEEELERERGVILQEIAMHQDAPEDLVFDHFHETIYPGQPLGRTILGTPDRISAFSSDDMRRYMGKHYHPVRMVVSAAGNVDHDQLVKLIDCHFEYTDAGESLRPPLSRYIGGDFRKPADFEQMHLLIGFPGMSFSHPDYFAAQVMTTALGGGMSSRLFQEVREKRGLAYSVYAFMSSYEDNGLFGMYAAAGEASAKELVPVMCDEVLRMAKHGITQAELDRARNQHTAGLQMVRENVSSVAEWIGRHLLSYGEYRSADFLCEQYEKVSRDDVTRTLRNMLASGPMTLTALGPHEGLPDYQTVTEYFNSRLAAA